MLLSLSVLLGRAGAVEEHAVGEYQLKAAFIFNFTKFVEWPAPSLAATNAPFVIGILGEDPFGKSIDDIVQSEKVRGHPLVVKRLKSGDPLEGCQILFISRSEKENLEPLLKQLAARPVLTVGEVDGWAARGVMVNLMVVQGTMKMEINRRQIDRSQLQASSKLLGLAKIVGSEK